MPREQSLASWLVRERGIRQGGRILAFIVTWGIALQDVDSDSISVEEYARYWNESVRTSYRDLERFREVFDAYGFKDPGGLIAVLGLDPENVAGASVESLRSA